MVNRKSASQATKLHKVPLEILQAVTREVEQRTEVDNAYTVHYLLHSSLRSLAPRFISVSVNLLLILNEPIP